ASASHEQPAENDKADHPADDEGELRRLALVPAAAPVAHSSPDGSSTDGRPPSSSSSVGRGGGSPSPPWRAATPQSGAAPAEPRLEIPTPGGSTDAPGRGASSRSSWSAIDLEWSTSQYFFGSVPAAKAARSLFFFGQSGPNSRPVCASIVANAIPGGT